MTPFSFIKRKIAAVDPVIHLLTRETNKDKENRSLSRSHTPESTIFMENRDVEQADSPSSFSGGERFDADILSLSSQLNGNAHIIDDKKLDQDILALGSFSFDEGSRTSFIQPERGWVPSQRKRPPRSPSQVIRKNGLSHSIGTNSLIMNNSITGNPSPLPLVSQNGTGTEHQLRSSPETTLGNSAIAQSHTDQSLEKSGSLRRSSSSDEWSKLATRGTHRRISSLTEYQSVSPSQENGRRLSSSFQNVDLNDLGALKREIKQRRKAYGDDDYRVGQVWNHIGNYFFRKQDYTRALDSYKGAVMCYEGGNAHIGAAYGNIGTVYWTTGDLENAVTFLNKALEMHRYIESIQGVDPDSSSAVSNSLYQIGLALSLQQDFVTAMGTLKYCRRLREKTLGSKHLDLARTIDAIGKIHLFRGELVDAMECHQQALAMKREFVSDSNSAVITSLMNIAAVHEARQFYDDAIFTYMAVLTVQKEIFLADHSGSNASRIAKEAGETVRVLAHLHELNGDPQASSLALNESQFFCSEAKLSG
jgi:tetratricopeptide (TPR) repeat protein